MHGLSAIKAGYREKKEEMSENNVEVATITKEGFKLLETSQLKEYLNNLSNFKPENLMEIE